MTVLEELPTAAGDRERRRTELARFLKACRARVTPEDVGLPPGLRRRTPGLRREEVAQLAGVGVTWYTWLEQGRPINASEQVLLAVSRALRLDGTERQHLFRLAGMSPSPLAQPAPPELSPSIQVILDSLAPLPAAVSNTRFDVLSFNRPYRSLFGTDRMRPAGGVFFNSLWCMLAAPSCCNPCENPEETLPRMVAVLRAAYGKHVGEPAWEEHVQRLSARSELFRELWARQEVSPPKTLLRMFRHPELGVMRLNATYLTMPGVPECYIVVYVPKSPEDRELVERLNSLPPGGWSHTCAL
ncbi:MULTISPECIES: helix-turn-helix transcriptional regulator [Kitasatospora]|uniref:Helix-turn-helix transcriptional regulator n=1 Tax=Kitasatospora cathayae TaxID=3004092 RepID=A0ABY7Q8A9_9ACTN|nr:helix-turn-helix transcriptional regulator [Kitasatospora sp. HUAS 3-15]WBP88904.1 helix-turn-helix transcriptional regulator [Kitasatospora sp. HUAS 3-15]